MINKDEYSWLLLHPLRVREKQTIVDPRYIHLAYLE